MLLWCHEAPLPGRERPFVVVCLCLVRWFGKGKHYRFIFAPALVPTCRPSHAANTKLSNSGRIR